LEYSAKSYVNCLNLEKVLKEWPVVDVLLLAATLLEEHREELDCSGHGVLVPSAAIIR
jgi:hypothetical protein